MNKILFLLDFADSFENCERVGSLPRNIEHFKALSTNFIEAYILSPDIVNFSDHLGIGGIHYPLPSRAKKIRLPVFLFLSPLLNKQVFANCDILWAKFSSMIPALIAKKIYKKPIICFFDYNWSELSWASNENIVEYNVKSLIEKLIIKHSDYIITTTDTLRSYLIEKGFHSEKKIYLLPNSVDTKAFSPILQKKINEQLKVLSVGRLNEQKNFPLLIESISVFQKKHDNKVKLTIVGTGPLKSSLLDFAYENGVNLTIIDRVPNNEMPEVYNNHDIFVMTSPREGHPRALLEAMSCGLPVVCTNVKGIRDIIKDNQNGLLSDQDKEDIANKILRVMTDKNTLLKLSKNARKEVIEKYSFEALIQEEVYIYQSIFGPVIK